MVLVGCGEGPCENGVQVCDSGHGGGAEGECGWRVVVCQLWLGGRSRGGDAVWRLGSLGGWGTFISHAATAKWVEQGITVQEVIGLNPTSDILFNAQYILT